MIPMDAVEAAKVVRATTVKSQDNEDGGEERSGGSGRGIEWAVEEIRGAIEVSERKMEELCKVEAGKIREEIVPLPCRCERMNEIVRGLLAEAEEWKMSRYRDKAIWEEEKETLLETIREQRRQIEEWGEREVNNNSKPRIEAALDPHPSDSGRDTEGDETVRSPRQKRRSMEVEQQREQQDGNNNNSQSLSERMEAGGRDRRTGEGMNNGAEVSSLRTGWDGERTGKSSTEDRMTSKSSRSKPEFRRKVYETPG